MMFRAISPIPKVKPGIQPLLSEERHYLGCFAPFNCSQEWTPSASRDVPLQT